MYGTGWPEQAGHYSIPPRGGGYFLNKLLLQYVCMFSLKRILLFYIMIMTERPIGQTSIAFGILLTICMSDLKKLHHFLFYHAYCKNFLSLDQSACCIILTIDNSKNLVAVASQTKGCKFNFFSRSDTNYLLIDCLVLLAHQTLNHFRKQVHICQVLE